MNFSREQCGTSDLPTRTPSDSLVSAGLAEFVWLKYVMLQWLGVRDHIDFGNYSGPYNT